MKKNIFLIFSMMILALSLKAAEFGEVSPEVTWQQHAESTEQIISNSKSYRQKHSGRTLASMSKKDQEWYKKWEQIWNDESDTDYLSKASKL